MLGDIGFLGVVGDCGYLVCFLNILDYVNMVLRFIVDNVLWI